MKKILRRIIFRFGYELVKTRNLYVVDSPQDNQYFFLDNSKENENLLIVIAGYQPLFWNNLFNHIKLFTPLDVDVVVVYPGGQSECDLRKKCQEFDFLLSQLISTVLVLHKT